MRTGIWSAAVAAAGLVCLALLSLTPLRSPDEFLHLRAGATIVEARAVPHVDSYSYTATGNAWVTHEWLAETVSFLTYSAGGFPALIVGKFLLLAATFAILFRIAIVRGLPAPAAVAFLLAVALLGVERFTVRPHLATYLFFALTMMLVLERERFPTRLALLPFVFALWANLHAGVIFGIGALAASAFVDSLSTRRWDHRLLVVAVICTVAALANPNGWDVLLYPFRHAASPGFRSVVAEHHPLLHPAFAGSSFLLWFAVVAGITVVAAMIRSARPGSTWSAVAICLGLLAATLGAERNRVLFGVAAVPVVAALFDGTAPRWLRRIDRTLRTPAAHAVVLLGLGAFAFFTIRHGTTLREGQVLRPDLGLAGSNPIAVARFLEEADVEGRMLNEYRFGGYFLWALPDREVFIDGRNLVYGERILDDYVRLVQARPGFERLLDDYEIETCVLLNTVLQATGALPLAEWLSTNPDWTLVHLDDVALVYVRSAGRNADLARTAGFRWFDPHLPHRLREEALAADPRDVALEIERLLVAEPRGVGTWVLAATALASIHLNDPAVRIYEDLVAREGERPEFMRNLEILRRRRDEASRSGP